MAASKGIATINGVFKGKDIISLNQFSQKDLMLLFSYVPEMKKIATSQTPSKLLEGTITTLLFYEPSSRTFGSFNASVKRLGGQTVDIINPQQFSSVVKGETLEDTVRVFEAYSNAIVIRHPEKGAAAIAASYCKEIPVINAGDGIGEHPTQALLDLYTLYDTFGRLDNLTGLLAGDALNSRTIHSLAAGLSLFKKTTVYILSPDILKFPKDLLVSLRKKGLKIIEITDETDIPKTCNFWYWTRVQKERFSSVKEYEKVKSQFVVTPLLMKKYANKDMILMDPLPRVKTIDTRLDRDPRSVYLRSQIRNGMYIRMALLGLVLGRL
ncbi:MAG: aspartate carbamoyltransferase [Candidatus Levybacteria bacterium]|nr:aspartate carbamoyltransferase [Candidatus Levybacteria bacterium]